MASLILKPLAMYAGKSAYEKSGMKKAVHKIPIIGDIASIFGFQHGGRVPHTGLHLLHAGETVIPTQVVKRCIQKRQCPTVRKYAKRRGKLVHKANPKPRRKPRKKAGGARKKKKY